MLININEYMRFKVKTNGRVRLQVTLGNGWIDAHQARSVTAMNEYLANVGVALKNATAQPMLLAEPSALLAS